MCPHESPGLADVWGDEFEALYTRYVVARSTGCMTKIMNFLFLLKCASPGMRTKKDINGKFQPETYGRLFL